MKLLYKPVSILAGVLGGLIARSLFKQVWKLASKEDEAPKTDDIRKSYVEVVIAAALQGAIFAAVKAAVDRGAAEGTRRLTGYWPGTDSEAEAAEEAEKAEKKAGKKAKKGKEA